jgi:hypothetical protein
MGDGLRYGVDSMMTPGKLLRSHLLTIQRMNYETCMERYFSEHATLKVCFHSFKGCI